MSVSAVTNIFGNSLSRLVSALFKTIASFAAGHRQRWTMRAADPFLQGGSMVVDVANGDVVYFHKDKFAGDHAPISELANAAEGVVNGADR